MRDFFGRQESVRRKSVLLIVLFFLSVMIIVLFLYTVSTVLIVSIKADTFHMDTSHEDRWDAGRFIWVSGITLLIILAGTIYKIRELVSGGGRGIAEQLGGRPVMRNTQDAEERKLLNVVEEMAIASGVPVPEVYLMERETGVNAFAAGYGIEDAVVCVTKGAIFHLNRDEVQGMVAHEFSHILNGDTLINIRLMGWLHGILMFTYVGRMAFKSLDSFNGGGSDEDGLALWHPVFIALWMPFYIIGSVGYFMGALIKVALSRQREYLADASAVQFTRNPLGLARALKKIGGLPSGSELWHPNAAVASHMYFSYGLGAGLFDFMKTHPPLPDRIEKLDPYFDGTFPRIKPLSAYNPAYPNPSLPLPVRLKDGTIAGAAATAILENMGAPAQEYVAQARQMIEELPDTVHEATREPWGARALVYTLLLGQEEEFRSERLALLERSAVPEIYKETKRLAAHLDSIAGRARLPLLDMSMPALRRLSNEQYRTFRDNTMKLIRADGKLSLFEYTLTHVLIRRLDAHFTGQKNKPVQIYTLLGVARECAVVLSIFSRLNKRNEQQALEAFGRGLKALGRSKKKLDLLPGSDCNSNALDNALDRLAVASHRIKRFVLAACLECLLYDQTVAVDEAELFRAVAEALDIPAPPWLAALSSEETRGTEAA